jgi:FAD-dependent urate hydroxylase
VLPCTVICLVAIQGRKLRIVVVGAGVAGLALAQALQESGYECLVFEEASRLRLTGTAVTMWPSGCRALGRVGVPIDGLGQRIERFETRTARGRLQSSIDGERLARRFGAPAMIVPRHRLVERLADGLAPTTIRFSHECVGVEHRAGGARVTFGTGDVFEGDVVIAADGHRSAVRRSVFGGAPAAPTGWAEFQGFTSLPTALTDGHVSTTLFGVEGSCGLMPMGDGLLQWWFAMPWQPDRPKPTSIVTMLRDRFGDWMAPVPELLEAVAAGDVHAWPYVRHEVPQSLVAGRVVLVGDAAHAVPPTLSQGANQALDDAAVLSEQLRSQPVDAALGSYQRARRWRVRVMSRLAAAPPAQDPDTWSTKLVARVPSRLATWGLGSMLRVVSNSLA